jgi:L-ascorbate metabolism protein UlaG (beta-lactamase superfamily)
VLAPGRPDNRAVPETARITFLGHATVLVELGGVRFLTDPVLRARVAHLRRHGPRPGVPRDVDAVLISHLHHDHLDLPSLRLLGGHPRVIAPAGAKRLVERAGFQVEELEQGRETDIRGVRVEAVRALHPSERLPVRGPWAEPLGFVIGRQPSVYFAGDTDLFPEMEELASLDVALLPVAGWGPRLGPGHMDAERAAQAAAVLRPRVAIPIHWGTLHPRFTRRGEWFSGPGSEFAAQVAAVAPEVEVRVLRPGESTSVAA